MRRKRLWILAGVVLLAGGALFLLLSTLTVHAVVTSTTHTTVEDFNPGTFYLTGMTQQGDGEVALLRIGIAGEWISPTVQGLPPLYGHAMVEHNGYVYVLGGKLTGGALTRAVFMSHVNTTTYMLEPFTTTTALPLSAYPNGVYMHSAVVVSDHLYVIGGDVPVDVSSVPTSTVAYAVFNADGTLGQWQSAPSMPDLRSRVPAVVVNGYIYVPGGKSDTGGGQASTGVVFYAPVDANGFITGWTTATASLPYSPQGQMVAAYNGRVYVMGGYDYVADAVQPYVYFATPSTTTGDITAGGWVSTTPMQRSIMGGVALAFNGELLVLGGVVNFVGSPVGYARSALLDIESGQVITFAPGQGWYDAPALSPDRVWHAAVTSRDHRYIYVLGGTGGDLNSPLNEGLLNRGSTTGVGGGSGYARSGWYVGPTIDLGLDRRVLNFNWTAEIPSAAVTLTMQYRTQDIAGSWGDWSAPIPPDGASGLITTTVLFPPEARAFRFQYRASLTTTAPLSYTPYLHHFELVYDVPQPPHFQKQAVPSTGSAVLRGQRITYTLSFSNPNDLSPLRNVLVTDTLPAYLTYVPGSITATAGITPDVSQLPELRWQVGTLATQTGGQVGFVVVVSDAAPIDTPLVNRARFHSSDTNDLDSATSHLVAQLVSPVLTKTAVPADGALVQAGQTLSYTLTYSNPNAALPLEMTITDSLPISASLVPGSCPAPTCTVVGNELRWQFTLPPLSQGQVSFAAVVAQGTVSGTVIANTGYAVGCVPAAGVCSDNFASNPVTHRVVSLVPPVLRKDADPPSGTTVLRGSLITYTLAFTNPNVSDVLTGVVIRDPLPANTSFVTCTGGCSNSAGVVTWTFPALAPGASSQVQVMAQVALSMSDDTTIQNQASLTSEQGQADSNTVVHHARVPYDLQLNLTSNVTATLPGSSFIYTFAYTNVGPLTLAGVVITRYIGYALPGQASAPAMPYLTILGDSPNWQLAQSSDTGNIYRYDVGTLGPNQAGALTMSVRLRATVPYTVSLLSHRAVIADDGAKGYEVNPFNQSPEINSPIQGPDLLIADWHIVSKLSGSNIVLTVTATIANRGLSDALTWDHPITPTNNWFFVELYAKPSSFVQSGPPTGPHDHAGGYCDTEDMNACRLDSKHWRIAFIGYGNPSGATPLAPGASTVWTWSVSLAASEAYLLYLQVDSGFWSIPDPAYGRVLEYNEMNNVVSLGGISTRKVYFPLVMRR